MWFSKKSIVRKHLNITDFGSHMTLRLRDRVYWKDFFNIIYAGVPTGSNLKHFRVMKQKTGSCFFLKHFEKYKTKNNVGTFRKEVLIHFAIQKISTCQAFIR